VDPVVLPPDPPEMPADILRKARSAKGFMPEAEGEALYRAAMGAGRHGPMLEIGTYCGKSALYFGAAADRHDQEFFTIDHHRGSEENQPGWEHHDPEVVDEEAGRIDTLPYFRRNIREAGLEETVIGIVGHSTQVASHWEKDLSLVFIDGGHGREPAHNDYEYWSPKVAPGGLLLIHDVFEDPEDGGRPPYEIYTRAVESGGFEQIEREGSLRILRREHQ
jgi:predicted O-methyltransferase YrrM